MQQAAHPFKGRAAHAIARTSDPRGSGRHGGSAAMLGTMRPRPGGPASPWCAGPGRRPLPQTTRRACVRARRSLAGALQARVCRAFGETPVTCQNSVRAPGTRRDVGRNAFPRCLARVLKRLVRGFVRPTLMLPVSSVLQSRFGQAAYSAGRYSSRPVLLRATRVRRGTRVGAFASSFARSPVEPPLSGVSELTSSI